MVVTEKNYSGLEEIYNHVFFCPSCLGQPIFEDFKLCPFCGVELTFDLELTSLERAKKFYEDND